MSHSRHWPIAAVGALIAVWMIGCSKRPAPLTNDSVDQPPVSADAVSAVVSAAGPVVSTDSGLVPAESEAVAIAADAPLLSEADKIERLLECVASLRDAVFVRNGSDHTPEEAVAHLRRKLASDEESRADVSAFIDRLASKSSLSGEPYLIRYADGTSIKSADFLNQRLAEFETH